MSRPEALEFERELISERTRAGLASARGRGRRGGRKFKMTPAKVRLARVGMASRDTQVGKLCDELGVTRQTLYRFVSASMNRQEIIQKIEAHEARELVRISRVAGP